jgi:hypothetical protein
MPRAVTNREKKERGQYCETLAQQVLRSEGFEIKETFEGGETRAKKGTVGSCPDLVIQRPGEKREYRIEVKSGQVWETDNGKDNPTDGLLGVKPDRPGRIQLAAGKTRRTGIAHKDCYALSLDDQNAKVQTLEFFDPVYMDKWLKRDIDRRRADPYTVTADGKKKKKQNSSKFPLRFLRDMRENHPCPINELKGKTWLFDKNGKLLKDCDVNE